MRTLTIALVATLALSACTPEQLDSIEAATGADLSAARADLLALPDVPIRLADGREILPSGAISAVPVAPAGSRCPQFFGIALGAGWPASDWQRLDYVMWRESRCNPGVYNGKGRDNSYGLMQLNMLAHRGWVGPLVGGNFSLLFDPATNLGIARELFRRAGSYGCPWRPWTTRSTAWCG